MLHPFGPSVGNGASEGLEGLSEPIRSLLAKCLVDSATGFSC
jgi:hypothetical protein